MRKRQVRQLSNEEKGRDSALSSLFSFNYKFGEWVFNKYIFVSAFLVIALIAAFFISLIVASWPSIKEFGISFFFNKAWDPVNDRFGALPFLVGTLLTSILSLAISLPFSLSISILLGEYYRRGFLASFLKSAIELLAGIPSIIYGFWGMFVLVPIIRDIQIAIGIQDAYGVGIFTSSIILAIMILPYSASIGRDVIDLVPVPLKEAAYALGATRFEVVWKIIVPYSSSGIMAGIMLAFGRALGETMAVTMVIGNSHYLPKSIFDVSNTMASVIANEFSEADSVLHYSSLIELGLVLLVVSAVINIAGKIIIKRMSVGD